MIDAAGLRVMKAIADEGSFTAAAASLGYTQPAISQMVRRLEQRTGTVLVERVGRNVRLTEAGQVLARHATPVLAALDAAEEEVAAIAGLRSGRVRLMAFPSASATLVPRALSLVKQRFPDVNISFTEAEPPESLAALKAGECDLAVAFAYEGTDLGRGEEDLDQFVITPLLDDEVRLAVPEGHPVAGAGERRPRRPGRRAVDRRLPPLSRPPAAADPRRRLPPRRRLRDRGLRRRHGPGRRGPGRRAHPRPHPAHRAPRRRRRAADHPGIPPARSWP